MSLAAAAAAALALITAAAAAAEFINEGSRTASTNLLQPRENTALDAGCVHEGRWVVAGAAVRSRDDACLRCVCAGAALSCRRRACAAPPAPPPRCHLRYRRGACCPEIHCPDRVIVLENEASARMDEEAEIASPAHASHACVEGGSVWAAGSALAARAACEACFCLAGQRRCVRPRCLPPPPGCRAPPAPGACCPHRYYCDHPPDTAAPHHRNLHECVVNGTRVAEGARAAGAERDACVRCFCLRGEVRCQPLQCAPALGGCTPLLRAGDCCPHHYRCPHPGEHPDDNTYSPMSYNSLVFKKNEDRSFHSGRSSKTEIPSETISVTSNSTENAHKAENVTENLVTTTKVKRKTNEPTTLSSAISVEFTTIKNKVTSTHILKTTTKTMLLEDATTSSERSSTMKHNEQTTTEQLSGTTATEQPEESVRIVINGTINCTAELSSTADPVNSTHSETHHIHISSLPDSATEEQMDSQTTTPVEIITNRFVDDGLDDNGTFTVNVTSALFPSNNRSAAAKPDTPKVTIFEDVPHQSNKKNKEDYDFDYTEPTLPPSLPNLKIIPFVAADAVVDTEEPTKHEPNYSSSEKEDKYPVYYPNTKDAFATRREDVYPPTQYPVFSGASAAAHGDHDHAALSGDFGPTFHEYTITASLGNRAPTMNKALTKTPTTSSTYRVETPAVNLFSPPVETEGGFIPKGPGIIDEYYAVYPSTPQTPTIPHLTTSMQLDTEEGSCLSTDGRRVAQGEAVSIACSVCRCVWAELQCAPRPCRTPPRCTRRPAPAADPCCGRLLCPHDNKTTLASTSLSTKIMPIVLNDTENENREQTQNDLKKISNDATSSKPFITDTTASSTPVVGSTTVKYNATTEQMSTTELSVNASHSETMKQNNLTNVPSSAASPTERATRIPSAAHSDDDAATDDDDADDDDDEDEDDGGSFSFGNVLKLLLSDSYDSTTAAPKKKLVVATRPTPAIWNGYKSPATTIMSTSKPTVIPFAPTVSHIPYNPPKKTSPPTVNRIDHLVLGEATAIKKTTPRPYPLIIKTTPSLAAPPFRPISTTSATTQKPYLNSRPETTSAYSRPASPNLIEESERRPAVVAGSGGVGGGVLKLAGCNIYGRMYRVGRIIAELSTPCQECTCTELGVQCRALPC